MNKSQLIDTDKAEPADTFTLEELGGASEEEVTLDDMAGAVAVVSAPVSKQQKVGLGVASGLDGTQDNLAEELAVASTEGRDSQDVLQGMLDGLKQKNLQKSTQDLRRVMADPDISIEEKEAFYSEFDRVQAGKFSLNDEYATDLLVKSKESPSKVSEGMKLKVAASVEKINRYSAERQARFVAIAGEDPEILETIGNIGEILVPFVEALNIGQINKKVSDGNSGYLYALTMTGSSKAEIREGLQSMNLDDRRNFEAFLMETAERNSGIFLAEENRLAMMSYLSDVAGDEEYTTTDKWIDNTFAWLDLTIIGGLVKTGVKSLKTGRDAKAWDKLVKEMEDVKKQNSTRKRNNSTSSQEVANNFSDEEANNILNRITADETDETSEILSGVSREDAIADANLPEIGNSDVVRRKAVITADEEIARFLKENPLTELDDLEIASAIEFAKSKVAAVNSKRVVARGEMNRFVETGTGLKIEAFYSAGETGWASAQDAIAATKFALKDLGVPVENIQVVARTSEGFVPVTLQQGKDLSVLGETGKKLTTQDGADIIQEYMVKVDYDYDVAASDVTSWVDEGVSSLNFFDRFKSFTGKDKGSLTRHLFDPASLFKGRLFQGASVAVDRSSQLENLLFKKAEGFTQRTSKLPKERQQAIDYKLKEANLNGEKFDEVQLTGDGFSPEEVDIMRDWKDVWDTMYWLENRDLGKTLRNQGYKIVQSSDNKTSLVGKPVKKGLPAEAEVYDVETGLFTKIGGADRADLYANGNIFKLRRPQNIDGKLTEYVKVDELEKSSYSRAINADEQVLAYREGYYTTHYDANYFVRQVVRDSQGEILYEKAIATANNETDAASAASRLSREKGIAPEDIRYGKPKEEGEFQDMDWDLQMSTGRSTQKVRGERLRDESDDIVINADMQNVLSPADSLIRSVRSTARRTSMRDYLDNVKARFVEQYMDELPTKFGEAVFPRSIDEIGKVGAQDKKTADMRTTYEYINYLENGYINSLDNASKAVFNAVAQGFSEIGKVAGKSSKGAETVFSQLEEATLALAKMSPTQTAKSAAFQLYIAANPIRQILVQGHQGAQLLATFGKYPRSTEFVNEFSLILMMRARGGAGNILDVVFEKLGSSKAAYEKLYQEYMDSGLAASIDKQNLVRGTLAENLKDASLSNNVAVRAGSGALNISRKAGFDVGEEINILSAWLAHRNKAATDKGSKTLTRRELGDVAAGARNFTYGMNAAGDMPYNLNWMSMHMQFMQVPHKAMLTLLSNQKITAKDKAKLGLFNMAMYSLPPATMITIFGQDGLNLLPDEGEARDAMIQGLEGYAFNKLASVLMEEETKADFSSIAPFDPYGSSQVVVEMINSNFFEALAATPSGSLVFGANPRITNFAKSTASILGFGNEEQDQVTAERLAIDAASLFSGLSNTYKATYALKYQQGRSLSTGKITDESVSQVQAILYAFGIGSMEEAIGYSLKDKLYKDTKQFDDDVKSWYKEAKRRATGLSTDNKDREHVMKVINRGWQVFDSAPSKARRIVLSEIKRDMDSKNTSWIIEQIMTSSNTRTEEQTEAMLINAGDTEYLKNYRKAKALLDENMKEE